MKELTGAACQPREQLMNDSVSKRPEELTLAEFDAIGDELAEMGADLPVLPPEAYERRSFYEGRY